MRRTAWPRWATPSTTGGAKRRWEPSAARVLHPAGDDGLGDRRGLGVGEPVGAGGGRRHDHGVDLAGEVRAAGGGVVVGGVVERLDGEPDDLLGGDAGAVALLQRRLGE